MKDITIFLKKKEKKSDNMVMNATKNPSEDEKQKLVEYRKNFIKQKKMSYYNYKKVS